MTEKDMTDNKGSESIVANFHIVESLIPKNQKIIDVTPEMTVAEAITIMENNDFSQLPVISDNEVFGLFSFRSLTQKLLTLKHNAIDFSMLPVNEFVEKPEYAQPSDEWHEILDKLDKNDVVLVGNRYKLAGLLTSMDVLNYLKDIASPFVLVAEIEKSLRRIIEECVNKEQLEECVRISLKDRYQVDEEPIPLNSMTLSDYIMIICNKDNWAHFKPAFGLGNVRNLTYDRLEEVRILRNDIFHFKRQLGEKDLDVLREQRKWLEMKARLFEQKQRKIIVQPEKSVISTVIKKRKNPKLNLDTLRAAVSPLQANFLFWMHDEAVSNHFIINWVQDSFVVRTSVKGKKVSFIYGSNWGGIRIYLHKDLALTPSQTAAWRQELNKSGILKKNGEANLTGYIRPENQYTLREIVLYLFGQVSALTRYPLKIQVTTPRGIYHAVMLDAEGQVEFDGKEYSSVSAAGVVASGWPSCNGWTFWHYYDDVIGEWRPIDDLRK